MSFHDWIYSIYPNDSKIDGRWGLLHIFVLVLCILLILFISIFKNKRINIKRIIIFVIAGLIFIFEISRRIINISRGMNENISDYLYTLLPRPWCAISCFLVLLSVFINKSYFYNITSICSLLCALIFFAYPSVGFNDKYILFENLYSIGTHSLLLINSISLIILGFTDFNYYNGSIKNSIIREISVIILIYIYSFLEIFVLKIEKDPLYFMPDNEVQKFLNVNYWIYLIIYIVFICLFINSFYIVTLIKNKICKSNNH